MGIDFPSPLPFSSEGGLERRWCCWTLAGAEPAAEAVFRVEPRFSLELTELSADGRLVEGMPELEEGTAEDLGDV